MSAWTGRHIDGKVVQKIVPPHPRIPWWKGPGADSGGVSHLARDPIRPNSILQQEMKSLVIRTQRLKLNRMSLHADFIKDRFPTVGITLRDLMQADLMLFLRDAADALKADRGNAWNPVSLIWSENQSPFEIFAWAVSAKYLQRICGMLGVKDRDELLTLLNTFGRGTGLYLPQWNYSRLSFAEIIKPEKLGT
jgi:hypothetical protein